MATNKPRSARVPGALFASSGNRGRKQRGPRHPAWRACLSVELLEDRVTPTVFVVNSTVDGDPTVVDGNLTLREALTAANTNAASGDAPAGVADGDVILFDSTVFGGAGATITLDPAQGDLPIADDVLIDGATGSGGGATIVTVDGGGTSRIFSVDTAGAPGLTTVTLTGLTLQNGDGTGNVMGNDGLGGAVFISSGETVLLTSSTVRASTATQRGGGIYNDGSQLTITDSLADGNTANGTAATDGGGGLYSLGGTVTITGSSFSNNTATMGAGSGGGILLNTGTLTMSLGSLDNNSSARAGGGIEIRSTTAAATATLSGVIVTGNSTGNNPGNGGGLHITAGLADSASTVTVSGARSWATRPGPRAAACGTTSRVR